MSVAGNEITDINFFSNLSNLLLLDLSNNDINDFNPITKLEKLQTLVVAECNLSDISFLKSLKPLKALGLSNNKDVKDFTILSNLSSLQDLDISFNDIDNISWLQSLKELNSLYLRNNRIVEIEALNSLSQLQVLDLSSNAILNIKALSRLTKLNTLDIANNKIGEISILKKLTKLQDLNLSNSSIKDISSLQYLTVLRRLNLSGNKVKDISSLQYLKDLRHLDLSSNEVTDLSKLSNLTNLRYLGNAGNVLSDYSFIKKLQKLKYLNLDSNKIKDINFLSTSRSLTTLNLVNNEITDLKPLLHLLYKGVPATIAVDGYGIRVWNNPLVKPPENILIRGREATLKYFEKVNVGIIDDDNSTLHIDDSNVEPVIQVDEIAKIITNIIGKNDDEDSVVLGLFGKWGRGKTFLWQRIWKNIESNNKKYRKVEFHAWKYQDTPASWAYLYEAFTNVFYQRPKYIYQIWKWVKYIFRTVAFNIFRKGIRDLIRLVIGISIGYLLYYATVCLATELGEKGESTMYNFSQIVLLTGYFAGFVAHIRKFYRITASDLINKYATKHSYQQLLGFQSEIEKDLSLLLQFWSWKSNKTIAKLIKKQLSLDKKIILFVDDIDRCPEDRIIQVVDSLRVLLENSEIKKRLIVIIAVDETILKRAIRHKYNGILKDDKEKEDNLDILIREYIDKLFILGIKLGPLNNIEKTRIFENYVGDVNKTVEKGNYNIKSTAKKPGVNIPKFNNKAISSLDYFSKSNPISNKSEWDNYVLENMMEKNSIESIYHYEINEFEKQNIIQFLNTDIEITPREIRLFYNRYLLAKNILLSLKLNPTESKEWSRIEKEEGILAALILHYSKVKKIEEIKDLKADKLHSIELMEKQYVVVPEFLVKLVEVVEIVVPY